MGSVFLITFLAMASGAPAAKAQQRLPAVRKVTKLPAVKLAQVQDQLPEPIPSEAATPDHLPSPENSPPPNSAAQAPAKHRHTDTPKDLPDLVPPESPSDLPREHLKAEELPAGTATPDEKLDWWNEKVTGSFLEQPRWVTFDLETVLLDTLRFSPRIKSVSERTSVALERIVQQDAAFDARLLFENRIDRVNDPVGNSLITGGPPRLIEDSFTTRGGVQRTSRRGTEINLAQELGLRNSNSNFFTPEEQANARLSLSLTQPLLARGGRVYNERLLTQAKIDGSVSWQEMRGEVEQRIADVIAAYWRLYELRCQMLQQRELLQRGKRIEQILQAREDFDSGRIEIAKARQRVARRVDRQLAIDAEIQKQQAQLAALVGSEELATVDGGLEMIPLQSSVFPVVDIELHDAVLQGIEYRPEIRAATAELESAALSIQVTKAELLPELTAVVDSYLAGLRGNYQVFNSFTDQFTRGGPGIAAGLRYELPYGRRAARSRHREAHHLYQQRSEDLREAIQLTRAEIETALISVNTALAQQVTKRRVLATAIEEETVLTRRWEMMGGDGAAVGTVLENVLDAQQRRTDAEREWIAAQTEYMTSLVELQRAMGTLLLQEGIQPVQHCGDTSIEFIRSTTAGNPMGTISPQPGQAVPVLTDEGSNP